MGKKRRRGENRKGGRGGVDGRSEGGEGALAAAMVVIAFVGKSFVRLAATRLICNMGALGGDKDKKLFFLPYFRSLNRLFFRCRNE